MYKYEFKFSVFVLQILCKSAVWHIVYANCIDCFCVCL